MYTNYDPNQNYNPYAHEQPDAASVPANANPYAPSAPTVYGSGGNQNAWSASPPAPYYMPGPVGTPMSQPPTPRRSSTMKVVLIVLGALLAMMCVIGGIGAAMSYNLSRTDVVFSHAKVWVL